jgi:response regulator RpfG family c-di-GMP phosphodiesterase
MREGTVFKFRSQTGNIFVFSTSNASDSEDWSSAIEECIYQVVHPLDSAELTQEELRWKQEIGFKKQDKRATRTESQLVHITQQLIQETEARKNLEEQVLRLLMRVDALERKVSNK